MTADDTTSGGLARLAVACQRETTAAGLLRVGVPLLGEATGAVGSLVVEERADGLQATVTWGAPLPPEDLGGHEHGGLQQVSCVVPDAWRDAGVAAVTCRLLPGHGGHLVLAWADAGPVPMSEVAAVLLVRSLAALETADRLSDLRSRVDNAQQLAVMGDYDWHIASDTNEWSDQLYRIYGHEPQSFNASYERFLSLVHPDDRELVTRVHEQAYTTGEPYQMIERIVRPDGEVRHLATNGQVLMSKDGTPQRFRGTCVDITERVRAEEERERTRLLFQALVESTPDAIVVTDPSGRIVQANGQARALLGGRPAGRSLHEVFDPQAAEVTAGTDALGIMATGLDGRDLVLDVRSARLAHREAGDDEDRGIGPGLTATFLRDATPRLSGEAMAATLRETQVRRRQALEINDNVVQGLSAALYALEAGDPVVATGLQRRTLAAARAMMSDLLDPLDGVDLQPGGLVRTEASSVTPRVDRQQTRAVGDTVPAQDAQPRSEEAGGSRPPARRRPARVLVVDDSEDMRMLLTTKLGSVDGLEVVGEAPDGAEAVRLATELQPDLVLLDLAMPRMDGLQALPLIRGAAPGVRVVVLSGFEDQVMADKALSAGAARYVEKGSALSSIMSAIDETLAVA